MWTNLRRPSISASTIQSRRNCWFASNLNCKTTLKLDLWKCFFKSDLQVISETSQSSMEVTLWNWRWYHTGCCKVKVRCMKWGIWKQFNFKRLMGSLIFNFSLKVNLSSSGTLNLGPEPQHRTLHSCVHKPEWRKSVIEKSVEKLRFIKSKFWSWCSLRWQRHIGYPRMMHITHQYCKGKNQLFLEL